jgi:hypothetical protein
MKKSILSAQSAGIRGVFQKQKRSDFERCSRAFHRNSYQFSMPASPPHVADQGAKTISVREITSVQGTQRYDFLELKSRGVVIVFDPADGGQDRCDYGSSKAFQDGSLSEAAFWQPWLVDVSRARFDSAHACWLYRPVVYVDAEPQAGMK